MYTRKPFLLPALCFLALWASAQQRAAAEEARAAAIYPRLLRSTAYVKGLGTAWVVDRGKRLLVTNQHVVDKRDVVEVQFPAYRGGEVITEASSYANKDSIRGRVICTSVEQDLAVIQLQSLPSDVEELSLATRNPVQGDSVYSIGNPGASGALWVFTTGQVRAVYQKHFSTTGGRSVVWRRCQVVETSSPVNPGDSGGPVVNDRGELVAVV